MEQDSKGRDKSAGLVWGLLSLTRKEGSRSPIVVYTVRCADPRAPLLSL